jgi:trehalose 6-phosphate synthase
LAGFYRAADVALVTPLRDGMNLVAKEYVAAQDPRDPGVLVLSRFAGAAHELTDALLVNPHDAGDMADAIARARAMPRAERVARWSAMHETLRSNSIGAWAQAFLTKLHKESQPAPGALPPLSIPAPATLRPVSDGVLS